MELTKTSSFRKKVPQKSPPRESGNAQKLFGSTLTPLSPKGGFEPKGKADSTRRCSQAVPHPSTNRALRRLTSEVGRDPVCSTRYGRQREIGAEKRELFITGLSHSLAPYTSPCTDSRTAPCTHCACTRCRAQMPEEHRTHARRALSVFHGCVYTRIRTCGHLV